MEDSGHLEKGLRLIHVFCIASGAMIGSGLFVLPGLAHEMAGPGVIWSYVLAGLLATTGALSMAELATAMPKAGSDYFFIMRGFGAGVGSIAGTLSWLSLTLKSAFAIVGMATFITLICNLSGFATGVALTVCFVGLNVFGVSEAARVQVVLVFGLFSLILLYIVVGLPQTRAELLIPFAPHGVLPILSTAGFVFISYGGLLKVASVAEEVRDPGRVMPLGLVLALVCVTLLYALAVMVTSGVVETDVLNGSRTPLSEGGRVLMGRFGYAAMTIGAILAFVTTANAGIMAASRYLLALSRDDLLPGCFSNVNKRFKTPHVAVAFTGIAIVLSLLLELNVLVEAASCVLMLTYILCCLSVIVLRESGLRNYRPAFRSPLYPWLQLAGCVGIGMVLFSLGIEAFLISAVMVFVAFLMFWFYGRARATQESAMIHLLARLTDRKLDQGGLESELRQIIRERDEIVVDRFDRLIETATILDIGGAIPSNAFFDMAAERMAPYLETTEKEVARRLMQREQQDSTVLSPFLAVPHIVLDGESHFNILVARARDGVDFGEGARNVCAIFVLAGTPDERNFHLRALAAIAQVANNDEFQKQWMKAKDADGLRDVILLAERRRFMSG